jgi:hypothetical protein
MGAAVFYLNRLFLNMKSDIFNLGFKQYSGCAIF